MPCARCSACTTPVADGPDWMGSKYLWNGDPSIGLTRHAWFYEVSVLAIGEWHVN